MKDKRSCKYPDMEGQELLDKLVEVARSMGVTDIGVADASAWGKNRMVSARMRPGELPTDILPGARSVVVLGVPIQSTILDTAPSIYYNHLYNVVNSLLDQVSERLALEIMAHGHQAVFVPRDGYHGINGLNQSPRAFFSHRHAAYLAGMGTFGFNNMILTERDGPRIRLSSVITDAELPCGEPLSEQFCIGCGKCSRQCPASAVGDDHYPTAITDKPACVATSAELASKGISPCGRCIAVCPVGRRGAEPTKEAKKSICSYVKKK